jgi:hypothetical protein
MRFEFGGILELGGGEMRPEGTFHHSTRHYGSLCVMYLKIFLSNGETLPCMLADSRTEIRTPRCNIIEQILPK